MNKLQDTHKIDPEKYLLGILSKCTGKVENGDITWSIGDQWIWRQDFKNNTLWCYYYGVWQVFDKEHSMLYEQIQALHKKVVCKELNCEGLTPNRKLLSVQIQVCKELNCEGLTPDKAQIQGAIWCVRR